MTEQNQEPLEIEEPQVVAKEKPAIDIDGLVAELERAGVRNVEELSGKLLASQQAGRTAQLLGDERAAREALEARLREIESRKPQPNTDFMDYPPETPIDIESAIERSVNKVFTKREERAQQLQQANLRKWNTIIGDEDYHLVKDVWESKLKDPNFNFKVQNGQIDPVDEYTKTVRGYYKNVSKQALDVINTLRGGKKVDPPHTETGERTSANMVSTTPSGSAESNRIAELKAKTDKGHILSNAEELEMMDLLFGTKAPL